MSRRSWTPSRYPERGRAHESAIFQTSRCSPRPGLVLAYLNTEAVKRETRHIVLDHHFSHFSAALGSQPSTGPRGSLPKIREQMQRLLASTFRCVFHDEEKGRHAGDGFLIADKPTL